MNRASTETRFLCLGIFDVINDYLEELSFPNKFRNTSNEFTSDQRYSPTTFPAQDSLNGSLQGYPVPPTKGAP